jgi:hypothetical protein
MNAAETSQLLSLLKACGATHFKSQDFEVTMGLSHPSDTRPTHLSQDLQQAPVSHPVMNEDSTEKLKGLIDTLKMDDSQLLDKIFPAGAGG